LNSPGSLRPLCRLREVLTPSLYERQPARTVA